MQPRIYLPVLAELEKTLPVEKWLYQEMHVWPIIKMGLAYASNDYYDQLNPDKLHVHAKVALKDFISGHIAKIKDFKKSQTINNKNDVVFLGMSTERQLLGSKSWRHPHYGPLIDCINELNLSCLFLEYSSRGIYRVPRQESSCLIQTHLNTIAVKSVLKDRCPVTTHWEGFEDFKKYIIHSLKTRISNDTLSRILKRIPLIIRWANYYSSVLQRTQPKLCFVVSYYGPIGMAFVHASKQLNIPVIDLQHGVQSNAHMAYGNWVKFPANGYTTLPTHFWCWSEKEKDCFHRESFHSGYPKHILGGPPLLNQFLEGSNRAFIDADNRLAPIINRSKKQILLTLQGSECPLILRKTLASSPKDWQWWIRSHPIYGNDQSKLRKFLSTIPGLHYELQLATELPLYVLLKYMNVHITQFSSCTLEASQFNIPTLLIHPQGADYYQDLLDSGRAHLALQENEISEKITELLSKPFLKSPLKTYSNKETMNRIWNELSVGA